MTIFFEISNPFQLKPDYYNDKLMVRCVWLWFAITFLKVPFDIFCKEANKLDFYE
jgi:hypothetical protein